MLISVVTTILNEKEGVRRLLESLIGQEGPFEVVVVDAGSTDGTQDVVRSFQDGLDLHLIEEPGTRGHGLETGAAAAKGEAVAFIGGDDWADDGWLAAVRPALQGSDIVFGGHVMHGDPRFFSAGRVAVIVDGVDISHPGTNTIYRKQALARLGGFDPLFVTAEDMELNLRAVKAGLRIASAPDAIVHRTARTTPRGFLKQAFWNGYGRRQLRIKHGRLHGGYSLRQMLGGHASLWGLLRLAWGAMGYLWAVLRGASRRRGA